MNKYKKFLIGLLFQYPLYFALVNGLVATLGIGHLASVLVTLVIVLLYDIGEDVRKSTSDNQGGRE